MSRRKNKNNQASNTQKLTEKQIEEYALKFIKATTSILNNTYFANPFILSPFVQNQIIKNINMNPSKFSRGEIEKIISDPKYNEQAARGLAEYLYNKIMHFTRLVHYFGSLLEFDWYIEPTNADEEDMKTNSFLKSYRKAIEFIEKLDVKFNFPKMMQRIMLEDGKFYYMRENDDSIVFQEMPSDWCMIVRDTEIGFQYEFNMMYFLQPGVNIDDYAPEFKDYFEEYKMTDNFKKGYAFWKPLDPAVAPVFKFDINRAGLVPPFLGTFLDASDIDSYKDLYKASAEIQTTKLIVNKIPMNKENNGSFTPNNFAVDPTTAGQFNAIIQSALPKMVRSITSPFDTNVLDFTKDVTNKDSIVSVGEANFYDNAGTSKILFNSGATTASAIRASQQTDESFVLHMYRQFERFINFHLKQRTGKYRFKIHFEGTKWDRQERFDRAIKFAQFGGPVTYVAASLGKSPSEFVNMTNFENILEIKDKLKPLVSSHTVPNDGGAPKKKINELSNEGERTRDLDLNNR